MENHNLSEKEYEKLIQRIEFFDMMRNNLLTFSFTAVLAILGVAMTVDMNRRSVWLCLLPFCLIIPFSARISYYRLASAHINSFLKMYAKYNMRFEIGAQVVHEGSGKRYHLIAWLVNHEMVLLGIADAFIFILKYMTCIEEWNVWNYISFLIPVIFIVIVYIITDSTYDYKKMLQEYLVAWEKYSKEDIGVK